MKVGDQFVSNEGVTWTVEKYVGWREVYARSSNGTLKCFITYNLKNGGAKDPNNPSVFGKGFLGEGPYWPSTNGKRNLAYTIWSGIFKRCYCPVRLEQFPTYKGCEVASVWCNYQNFAAWYEEVEGGTGCVDKDLKYYGNKIYSPETCLILTPSENAFLTDCKAKRGDCVVGVSINADREDRKKKYSATVSIGSTAQRKHKAKMFLTEQEAFEWYAARKMELIPVVTQDDYKQDLFTLHFNRKFKDIREAKGW